MSLSRYFVRNILPGFKTGHTRYVEFVKEQFRDGCRWLDAGGGRRIFHDSYDGEELLVARASKVVVCDADPDSLKDHMSVSEKICCTLDKIPLPDNSFDFVTCGMVVEHLSNPAECFAEIARVMDRHGLLIVHTVNLYGYQTVIAQASKVIPFRKKLISLVTSRKEEDIFPTLYRCNTASAFRRHLSKAGFSNIEVRHMDAGLLFGKIWPMAALECLYTRTTQWSPLASFRGQLLVTARKA